MPSPFLVCVFTQPPWPWSWKAFLTFRRSIELCFLPLDLGGPDLLELQPYRGPWLHSRLDLTTLLLSSLPHSPRIWKQTGGSDSLKDPHSLPSSLALVLGSFRSLFLPLETV